MEDYIKLPDMREVFFELIPNARIQGRGNEVKVRVRNKQSGVYFPEPPLLIVDGVVTRDQGQFVSVDPLKVEQIDLISCEYYLGTLKIPGIVNIISQEGLCPLDFPQHVLRQSYEFVAPPVSTVFPDHEKDAEQLRNTPDFRNTLYWAPRLNTDINGEAGVEFFTSDETGDFTLFIEGFTRDGRKISFRENISFAPR